MWIEVLNILILMSLLRWIKRLKDCECAKGLSRDYMHFFFSVGLIFQFSRLLGISRMLGLPMAGLALVYGIVALRYINREKKLDCGCSGRVLTPLFFWITAGQTALALFQVISG